MKRHLFTLCILIHGFSFTHAQQFEWISYTNGHTVTDVAQQDALTCITTSGGMVLLDTDLGDTLFLNMTNSDLSTYDINCVAIDQKQGLWIGTEGKGIYLFDGKEWLNNPYGLQLDSPIIREIEVGPDGRIWLANAFHLEDDYNFVYPQPHFGGLYVLDDQTWSSVVNSDISRSLRDVIDIHIDEEAASIIMDDSLLLFNGRDWTSTQPDTSRHISLTHHVADGNGNIWAIGYPKEFHKYDGASWQNIGFPFEAPNFSTYYWSMAMDGKGTIYFGSWSQNQFGLIMYKESSGWTTLNAESSDLPTNRISSLQMIGDDLYIGTYGEGLAILNPEGNIDRIQTSNSPIRYNWTENVSYLEELDVVACASTLPDTDATLLHFFDGTHWTTVDTMPYGLTSALHLDKQGRMWAAGWKGVAYRESDTWHAFDTSNTDFAHNRVTAIAEDEQGQIWVAGGSSYQPFLAGFDGKTWTSHKGPSHAYEFNDMTIDKRGNKWLGAYDGLYKFDAEGEWHDCSDNFPLKVSNRHVDKLRYDLKSDRIWLATSSGLYAMDENGLHACAQGRNLGLAMDSKGNIWTSRGGSTLIAHSQAGKILQSFTSSNSDIPEKLNIRDITVTPDGDVYLATGYGIIRYTGGTYVHLDDKLGQNTSHKIFPNPSGGSFSISATQGWQMQGDDQLQRIGSIHTLNGSLVKHFQVLPGTTTIELKDLSPGIYILKIGEDFHDRIIIQ